jgi:hypothetical protein
MITAIIALFMGYVFEDIIYITDRICNGYVAPA